MFNLNLQVSSNESSTESSSDVQNSATEISTDSEFALEEATPTRDTNPPFLDDRFVTKTRGNYQRSPKKVQVKSTLLQRSSTTRRPIAEDIELKFTPLVPTPVIRKPVALRPEGYALNRTQSTGGIAAKVSLELKKKYLLGESAGPGNIQKSGSASTLDHKFKSFHSNISDCQKLLKPAPEVSANMKTFCSKLDERTSPTPSAQTPVFNTNPAQASPVEHQEKFQHESEARPRSPVHETSIIVPEINWQEKARSEKKADDSLDSSSSTSTESLVLAEQVCKPKFANIPRLEVHDDAGQVLNDDDAPFDSLNNLELQNQPSLDAPKSITNEKKVLNQPKPLPKVDPILDEVHKNSHQDPKGQNSNHKLPEIKNPNTSDRSTPSPDADPATELSDWARDEAVSEDYEDVVFGKPKASGAKSVNIATIQELDDLSSVSIKKKYENANKNRTNVELTECVNSVLNPSNLDNIEFMDNGTGTSSEDDNGNTGYVKLEDEEEDVLLDSLNPVLEAKNPILTTEEVPKTFVQAKKVVDNEDADSLLIPDAGTTTEENTCSDSTVKNVTARILSDHQEQPVAPNIEYQEHCQRLASKVEFGNAKDSIDVRKSRRKSKTEPVAKPDLIVEERPQLVQPVLQQNQSLNQQNQSLVLEQKPAQIVHKQQVPQQLYKREEIEKERDKNQKLIQEMVMNKMKAQNKSLERKKRSKGFSPLRPYDLGKSATTDLAIELRNSYNDPKLKQQKPTPPPDLITILPAVQKSQTVADFNHQQQQQQQQKPRTLSVLKTANSDCTSLPNINDELKNAPIGPQSAKENVYVQDSIESLVLNTERRNSFLYSNDTLSKKRNGSFRRCKSGEDKPERKSVPDFRCLKAANCDSRSVPSANCLLHKSDPNLLDGELKRDKRKVKDERRKSFTKFLADIFTKKKDAQGASPGKGLFAMMASPKAKEKSKVIDYLCDESPADE